MHIDFEFSHRKSSLYLVFFTWKSFNILTNNHVFLIHYWLYVKLFCFILFLVLFFFDYIFKIFDDFAFCNIIEYILNRLGVVINHQ